MNQIVGKTLRGEDIVLGPKGAFVLRRAIVEKVKVVDVRESTKSMERIQYDPQGDALVGVVLFQVDPYIPEADLTNTAELTRKSVYYGVVLKGITDYLNKHFRNFTDPEHNEFSNVGWDASDIGKIQMQSETFGLAEVRHEGASVNQMNLSLEAKLIRIRCRQIAEFQHRLARKGTRREASASDVAEAFAVGKSYAKPAGALVLVGGTVYSFETPIATWAIGPDGAKKPYLDLSRYSSTTSTHQNALLRALSEEHIRYEKVSPEELQGLLIPRVPVQSKVARRRK